MMKNLSRSGKARYWEKLLEQWRTTGLSQREYCRQNKIGLRTFKYWKSKIGSRCSNSALVEVPLQNLPVSLLRSCSRLCVVIDQHFRIEIEKGFDPEDLERVLRVLRRI
jgi:hypothetical protein